MWNYRDEFLENTYYLISNKGFNNSILFENSDDYKTFILYTVTNILDHGGISISAYSILPNSFYFVIKNQEQGLKLSDFMRKIQVSYAMYFKWYSESKSSSKWLPVFDGRFKAYKIELEELKEIESCVAFEPLRIGLVEDIKNWPYTSAHQSLDTGYNYQSQMYLKIYSEIPQIQKTFFTEEFLDKI